MSKIQTLLDIHPELSDLNQQVAELAAKAQLNFEELGT